MRLKLLKKRMHDVPVVADLRGIGKDPVIQNSIPRCYLRISERVPEVQTEQIMTYFELTHVEDKSTSLILKVRPDKTYSYKEESVLLFMTALALNEIFPNIGFALCQHNGLYAELYKATTQRDLPRESVGADLRNGTLYVDAACTLNLSQAGFDLETFSSGEFSVSRLSGKDMSDARMKLSNIAKSISSLKNRAA
jgi:hypothetical protein